MKMKIHFQNSIETSKKDKTKMRR